MARIAPVTPQARIVDENGRPTPEFYRFLLSLIAPIETVAAATGTATRTAFDTTTVTTAQLAERFKALVDDLQASGRIS